MEKVHGNGMGCKSDVCEEKRDLVSMTSCVPID